MFGELRTNNMSDPISPATAVEQPELKSRMLVLCFDGTSNEYDDTNTNVVKFFAMLRKDCDEEQLCYYQTGLGTYLPPAMLSPVGEWFAKLADEAFAVYLGDHVMQGYDWLMKVYRPGDKVSIFGFSRGAYTARALAGFVTKIGLLPRDNDQQVSFAYKLYKRTDKQGLTLASGFKKTFCRDVDIEFLGVWETVAATGLLMSRDLPFTTNNSYIKTFRHALALDEHRAKFVPTYWQIPAPQKSSSPEGQAETGNENDRGHPLNTVSRNTDDGESRGNPLSDSIQKVNSKKHRKNHWIINIKTDIENKKGKRIDPEEGAVETTDVKQVWFAGCHSDVGGGAIANSVKDSLSDIPLRWMVREVVASRCGILFDRAAMLSLNVHIDLPVQQFFTLPVPTKSSSGNGAPSSVRTPAPDGQDASLDKVDALEPTHDELKLKPVWWLLEVIPLPFSWQDVKGVWHRRWRANFGRGRYVNQSTPLLFHETVRVRMQDAALKYTPKAQYEKGAETYIW